MPFLLFTYSLHLILSSSIRVGYFSEPLWVFQRDEIIYPPNSSSITFLLLHVQCVCSLLWKIQLEVVGSSSTRQWKQSGEPIQSVFHEVTLRSCQEDVNTQTNSSCLIIGSAAAAAQTMAVPLTRARAHVCNADQAH